jgi:cytochrome b561
VKAASHIFVPVGQRHFVRPPAERLADTASGYGWISIALHWLTVAVVLTMLTIGLVTQSAPEGDTTFIDLHTTIGITAYVLLWARIVWRFSVGHPGPRPRQATVLSPFVKYLHFLLLIAIGVMLVSGPLMVWFGGEKIMFFTVPIPSPLPMSEAASYAFFYVHVLTGTFIIIGVVLHVLAVLKHTMVDRDGTLAKIIIADRAQRD